MGLISFLKSSHEVLKAASKSKGGRNIKKTMSGSSARFGRNGTKPITSPTPTNKIGKGNFILSVNAESTIRMVIIKMTISKLFIGKYKLPMLVAQMRK